MPPGRGFGVVLFSKAAYRVLAEDMRVGRRHQYVARCGGVPAPELTRMMLFPNTSEELDPDDLAQPLRMP